MFRLTRFVQKQVGFDITFPVGFFFPSIPPFCPLEVIMFVMGGGSKRQQSSLWFSSPLQVCSVTFPLTYIQLPQVSNMSVKDTLSQSIWSLMWLALTSRGDEFGQHWALMKPWCDLLFSCRKCWESRVMWLLVGFSPSAAVGTQGNVTEEDSNSYYMQIFFFLCFLTCLWHLKGKEAGKNQTGFLLIALSLVHVSFALSCKCNFINRLGKIDSSWRDPHLVS